MKQLFISIALAATTLLAGCQSEEQIGGDKGYVEPGATVLSFRLGNGVEPEGYAVGDEYVNLATDAEKEIRSVAFFVQTPTNFSYYLSTEEQLSTNGLLEPLVESIPGKKGSYDCQLKIKTDQFGKSTVVVLANFSENGLDTKVKAVTNMEELKNLISETVALSPINPLLMYAIDEDVELKEGQHVPVTFKMERLAARIDIENNAGNATDPDKGFVLESARLLNAKTATYIAGNHGKSKDIAVVDFPVRKPDGASPTQIDTLYTYEASNAAGDPVAATTIEIVGKFRGSPMKQLIPFVRPVDKGIVPIVRNTRYKVEIKPAPDSTQLLYTIKVKDWDSADTIFVEPNATKPELIFGPTAADALIAAGATWNAATKTIDISGMTTPADFAFTVKGLMDSKYKEVQNEKAPYIKRNYATMQIGDLVGYAAEQPSLTRLYTLTLTPQTDNDLLPSSSYFVFSNPLSPSFADTLIVQFSQKGKKPAFLNFDPQDLIAKGGKWDEATKTIDISSISSNATFKVSVLSEAVPATPARIAAPAPYSQRGNTWVSSSQANLPAINGVVASALYTLTLTKQTANSDVYPAMLYVIFANPNKTDQTDTITVKYYSNPSNLQTGSYNTSNLKGATWTADTKIIDITNMTQAGSFSFAVAGATDMKVKSITYQYDTKTTGWLDDKITYTDITTYGALERIYTIQLPTSATIGGDKTPKQATITLSKADGSAPVEFKVLYLPNYEGTSIKPVLYNGRYWAPVNCGATQIPTSISSTWSLATCGYLYQWGRKTPFSYGTTSDNYTPSAGAYPTYVQATTAGYANASKFIVGFSPDYSWFSDYKGSNLSPALTVGDNAWPRENQPCPAGYRVPTKDELTVIMTEANGSNKMNGSTYVWKATENSQFVLPAAGRRGSSDGSSYGLTSNGGYWSSTLTASGKSSYLSFGSSSASMNEYSLAYGFSVRCVQE